VPCPVHAEMSVDGIEEEQDIPARFRRAQEGGRGRCRGPRPIMVPHVTCHAPTGPPNSTLLTQPAELLHHHLPLPCACECDTATDPLRPASRLPPPPVTTTLGQVAICLPPPPPHRPTLPTTHGVAAIVAVSLCALPHHSATISVSPVPPPAPGGSLSLRRYGRGRPTARSPAGAASQQQDGQLATGRGTSARPRPRGETRVRR
jgi:hypothetical protein